MRERVSKEKITWACMYTMGFPGGSSGKEFICQCRRHKRSGIDPWVRKIPWKRAWQPTPEFLPGESHGQSILAGYRLWSTKKLDMTEWQSIAQYWELMLLLIESQMLSTLPSTKCVFNTLQPVTEWRDCQWKWKSLSHVRLFAIPWTI